MKTYKEFLIHAEPFNPELITSVLWELNISGINEEYYYLKVFSDENNVSIEDINSQLEKLKKEKLISGFHTEESTHDYKNWNEEWENKTNIINISDNITIKPTFREYEAKEGETVIIIDPKMSFGTGEHQTTRLSVLLIQKYVKPGYKVLDAGTGTGILAIASIKFGASYALGIDIDEWTPPNFNENVKLNSAEDKAEFRLCELSEVAETDFDLVVANIHKSILMEISKEVQRHLKEGGIILLSGILPADEEDIINRYTSEGLKFLEKQRMDEWIAMVFEKE
jgi:ribosomal protein L11 methyltransferase